MICLALALLLCGAALAEQASPARVGDAVDFEIPTLDGGTFALSEYRGKAVYLNLWATWCPYCVIEMPDIQKLADAHPDELVVIAASVDEEMDDLTQYLKENPFTFAIGLDEDYALVAGLFATPDIPESVFIDPDGVVSSIDIQMLSYDEMEQRLAQALGGQD